MILSNIEIQKAIDDGRLQIIPDPQPRNPESLSCPYNTTAVDLHLGVALAVPKEGPFNYDLRKSGFATFLARNCEHKQLTQDGYVFEPKRLDVRNDQFRKRRFHSVSGDGHMPTNTRIRIWRPFS
jgi:hypothetical protein